MAELPNDRPYTLRRMTEDDVSGALKVFASHGLYEARHSLNTYLQIDCNGFYVAIDITNDKVIGVCGGPFTRPDVAFIGLYSVDKEYFGRGIGQKLFQNVMDYIGQRNACLFSVPEKFSLYRDKLSFKLVAKQKMVIYFGKVFQRNSNEINSQTDIELKPIIGEQLVNGVLEYDQKIQRLRREKFLKLSLSEPQCQTLAAVDRTSGQIVGYGCIRENSISCATLSPVYADDEWIALQLINALITTNEFALKSGYFYYTIDTNGSAIRCAENLGMNRHEDCPLPLLFRNSIVEVDYQRIYSIFSPNFSL